MFFIKNSGENGQRKRERSVRRRFQGKIAQYNDAHVKKMGTSCDILKEYFQPDSKSQLHLVGGADENAGL